MQVSVREVDIANFFSEVVGIGNKIQANSSSVSPEALLPLVELLGGIRPSRAYSTLQKNVTERVQEYLGRVPWEAAQEHFTGTADESGREFLQRVTTAMTIIARDEIKQNGGKSISFPAIPVKWGDGMNNLKGRTLFSVNRLDPKRDGIFVNGELESLTSNPGESVVTGTHETWHLVNVALGQAVKAGAIERDHPLYYDGLYFQHQIARNAHYTVGDAYSKELDERTAIGFGDGIAWWLQQNCPQTLAFTYDENGPVLVGGQDENKPQLVH